MGLRKADGCHGATDGLKIGAGVWHGWRQGVEVGKRSDGLNYLVDSDRKGYCKEEADPASKLPFCDLRSYWIQPCCIINSQGSFEVDSINSKKQKRSPG